MIFRDHISKKAALANMNLGLIFRSLTYINKVVFLNLYKSLVCPHLEYSGLVTDVQKDSITKCTENGNTHGQPALMSRLH